MDLVIDTCPEDIVAQRLPISQDILKLDLERVSLRFIMTHFTENLICDCVLQLLVTFETLTRLLELALHSQIIV